MERSYRVFARVTDFSRCRPSLILLLSLATDFNQADTRSHRYTAVNNYTLTITLRGPNNIVTRTFSVVVERPVQLFTVTLPGLSPPPTQIIYMNSKSDRHLYAIVHAH